MPHVIVKALAGRLQAAETWAGGSNGLPNCLTAETSVNTAWHALIPSRQYGKGLKSVVRRDIRLRLARLEKTCRDFAEIHIESYVA